MKSTISHLAKPHWASDINGDGSDERDRVWGGVVHYEYLQSIMNTYHLNPESIVNTQEQWYYSMKGNGCAQMTLTAE